MRSIFAILCVLALTLAACGGDDDNDNEAATATSAPLPTIAASPTPAATATNTAEATAEPSEEATSAASPESNIDPDVQARLEQTALAIDDLPSGWQQIDMGDDDDDDSGACGMPSFENKEAKLGEVEVGFQESDLGPFVFQNLVEFPEADVLAAMDYVREITTCEEWTETDADGTQTVYRISPLEVGDFGDDSYAVAISTDLEGLGTLVNNTVFARVGNMLTIIVHSELGEPDAATTEEYVQAAVDKMARRSDE